MAGIITAVKEIVVQAQFDDDVPEINELLVADNGYQTLLLVDHIAPGGVVFCLNIRGDLRLTKGMGLARTHKGIEVPADERLIGRVLNALGDPLDGLAPISSEQI